MVRAAVPLLTAEQASTHRPHARHDRQAGPISAHTSVRIAILLRHSGGTAGELFAELPDHEQISVGIRNADLPGGHVERMLDRAHLDAGAQKLVAKLRDIRRPAVEAHALLARIDRLVGEPKHEAPVRLVWLCRRRGEECSAENVAVAELVADAKAELLVERDGATEVRDVGVSRESVDGHATAIPPPMPKRTADHGKRPNRIPSGRAAVGSGDGRPRCERAAPQADRYAGRAMASST